MLDSHRPFICSVGARNRVGIGLSYWRARFHRLAESIPGLIKSLKIPSRNIRTMRGTTVEDCLVGYIMFIGGGGGGECGGQA
jgi:hypothetical protein